MWHFTWAHWYLQPKGFLGIEDHGYWEATDSPSRKWHLQLSSLMPPDFDSQRILKEIKWELCFFFFFFAEQIRNSLTVSHLRKQLGEVQGIRIDRAKKGGELAASLGGQNEGWHGQKTIPLLEQDLCFSSSEYWMENCLKQQAGSRYGKQECFLRRVLLTDSKDVSTSSAAAWQSFLGSWSPIPQGLLTTAWLIAELGKMHYQPQRHPGGDLVCSWRVTEHLSLPFILKWG